MKRLLLLLYTASTTAFLAPSATLTHFPPSWSTPLTSSSTALPAHIHRDILIIGSGLAGLSIAHHLSTTNDKARHITILDRETPTTQSHRTVAGSYAAAGMLAPQSERMAAGPLLDICLQSREIWGVFVRSVEGGAREFMGEDGGGDGNDDGVSFLFDS